MIPYYFVVAFPCMGSIISKKKLNKTYYNAVVSKRVNGKPRIVSQTYLDTAERIAAPVPLQATALDCGLPVSLW